VLVIQSVKSPGLLLEMTEQKHLFVKPQALLFSGGGGRGGSLGALFGPWFGGGRLHPSMMAKEALGGLSFFLF